MFTEQLSVLLEYINNLPGHVCALGDMNIQFGNPVQSQTKLTFTTLSLNSHVRVINKPTQKCGHIIDSVVVRPDDYIHGKSTVADSLESDHCYIKSYINAIVYMPSTICRTAKNMTNIDRPLLIAELSSVSKFIIC